MQKTIGAIALVAAAFGVVSGAMAQEAAKPTIVLVHGAFADSSGWNGVIAGLNRDGYATIAAANPLRSLADDAAAVSAVVKSIPGDVVLVGHSYGGLVITADVAEDVTALMAATQRTVNQSTLAGTTSVATWKALPSFVIYGSADLNIPAEVERFMAERAGAVKTIEIEGGSHALMISHPVEVSALIKEAASILVE